MTVNRRLFLIAIFACGWLLPDLSPLRPVVAQSQPATTKPAATKPAAAKPAAAKPEEDEWNVIYMGQTRVGHSRSSTLMVKRDGRELIRSENETTMLFKRFGQELKMKMSLATEETSGGELVSVEFKNENPPNSVTKTTGRVNGDKLELQIENAGKTSKKSIAWDKSNKSPAYQDRMLREQPLKSGEKRQFKVFLPEMNQVATVTVTARDDEEIKLLDGKPVKLKRADIGQSVLPGFITKAWFDEQGHTLKSSTGLFGTEMATYRVSRDEALKEIVGAELDIALDTLIKIRPPIERAHESKQIVYLVTLKGHDPAKEFPAGDTQQIRSTGPETAELTVTSITPHADGKAAAGAAPDAGFSTPNRYLQSDDARVIKHADAAAGTASDPWEVALKMEKYVQEKLNKKNFSTALATAAEVAESLEGDCTEHACLLAAMCRVKKIPSRVVVGFVYADRLEAFGGHMWTEVFINGQWIPLDATLGRGGIGAAHIKLGDTGFQDEGPAPTAAFLPILRVIGNITLQVKSVK